MVMAVAKKKEDPSKTKGELMLSNMDAMEVRVCLIQGFYLVLGIGLIFIFGRQFSQTN